MVTLEPGCVVGPDEAGESVSTFTSVALPVEPEGASWATKFA